MILLFAVSFLLLPSVVQGQCVETHELNEDSGLCDWVGPKDACLQLVDFWNRSWYMSMPNFPDMKFHEVDLTKTMNPIDEYAVKVIVRRGCMYTGYAHSYTGDGWQELKVGDANLVYGAHRLPNFITGDPVYGDAWKSLSRVNCFCDVTEATVNGHVPAPPPDQKCIEHHEFNETTQQCEWTKKPQFCAELHTSDNRRKLLEIPNWPTNKKYDREHAAHLAHEHFHTSVTHIVVRQHCFATVYWRYFHEWKTLATTGYGFHRIANLAGNSRFVCECIKSPFV